MDIVEISLPAAVAAGAISFLSPCVLPLVPAFLCFVTGTSLDELIRNETSALQTSRVITRTVTFVLGFSLVFITLGAGASAISSILSAHLTVISQIAGLVIVVLGLHYMGLFRIAILDREVRFHIQRVPGGLIGAFLIGIAFAFGWTPCIGPILATILTIAAGEGSTTFGMLLLTAYALGLGIPFILAAIALKPFFLFLKRFRRHLNKIEVGAGVLLTITGILIFTNRLADLSFYLLNTFPILASIG